MLFLEVALLIEEILECCEIFRRAAHLDPFRGLALGNVVANLHLTLVGEWLDLAAGGSTAVVSCRITRFSRSKLRGRAIILDQKNVKVSAYSPHPPPPHETDKQQYPQTLQIRNDASRTDGCHPSPPLCPAGETYDCITYIHFPGELAMDCTLATSDRHLPVRFSDW